MKLVHFIEKYVPENNFNIETVFEGERPTLPSEIASCGSAGCVMGWAPSLFPEIMITESEGRTLFKLEEDGKNWVRFNEFSKEFFGLDREESIALFSTEPSSLRMIFLPNNKGVFSAMKKSDILENILAFVEMRRKQYGYSRFSLMKIWQ